MIGEFFVEHVFEGFVFVHVSKNVLISLQNRVWSECILTSMMVGMS